MSDSNKPDAPEKPKPAPPKPKPKEGPDHRSDDDKATTKATPKDMETR